MSSRFTRRGFIGLSAAATAAVAGRVVFRDPTLAQAPPATPRVLIEDVALSPGDLAGSAGPAFIQTPAGVTVQPGAGRATLTGPVLTARGAFTHLGLHWSGPGPSPAFEVRTAGASGGWSPWTPLAIEAAGKDTASGETFAALLSTGRKTRFQFRAAFDPAQGDAALTGITATLLNTTDGPQLEAQLLAAAAPDPSTAGRVTYTREQWGANEALGAGSSGNEIWPAMYVPVKKVVVHHTATSNSYTTVAQAQAEVRAIHTYHAQTLGWGDIGYHVLVDKFGNSYEGRRGRVLPGGREVLSEDVVAGHAAGYNYGSAGIASLGTHTASGEGSPAGVAPTTAARNRIAALIAWYASRRGIDPRAQADFLRLDETWHRGLANVSGHRDCNATTCPGGHLYAALPALRDAAAALVTRTAAPSLTAGAETANQGAAPAVAFSWTPTTGEYYLEGWRRVSATSEDIVYLAGYTADRFLAAFLDDTDGATSLGQAYAAFGASGAIEPGRYTLHVRSADGGSYERHRTVVVTPGGLGNTPPTIAITAPPSGSSYVQGTSITLTGSASDAQDGNLTSKIQWRSDRDGALGTGGSRAVTLSVGTHIITAEAKDSAGVSASAQITITVTAAPKSILLSARGSKVQGRQKVDLTWTGASTASIDVYRNGVRVARVPNTGSYRDNFDARGSGTYRYRVNEVGTSVASNEVTVRF